MDKESWLKGFQATAWLKNWLNANRDKTIAESHYCRLTSKSHIPLDPEAKLEDNIRRLRAEITNLFSEEEDDPFSNANECKGLLDALEAKGVNNAAVAK